jgi:hypothetical protein
MSKDPFGFDAVRVEEDPGLDIEAFAPKPRPTNRAAAQAVREVARTEGFTRRGPSNKPAEATPVADVKGRKRRVNITEVLGIQDRYPDTERAQLNMLAPVPIVLRWRKLVAERQVPAWETLEAAIEALEAIQRASPQAAAGPVEGGFQAGTSRGKPRGKALASSESR